MLHTKRGGATIGTRSCYYRLTIVLHWSMVLLLSLVKVLQMAHDDASNIGRGCFQWCSVLLLAGLLFWILAKIGEDFCYISILLLLLSICCFYNSKNLLLQYLR
jgi:hypothetical protein